MPQSVADDVMTEVKREQEVAERPGKTAPVPVPAPLQHEFSKVPYSAAAPKKEKSKSEMEKSLDWAAQQRKVAESQ